MSGKSEISKSEFWIVAIGSAGSLLSALTTSHPGIGKWVSFAAMAATAAVYAIVRTPLASQHPGWKTKTFWTSLVVIIASVAAAVAETPIAGISANVTKSAALVVSTLAALGYAAVRVKGKKTQPSTGA